MNVILDQFKTLVAGRSPRSSPSGWVNQCCPACGDRRFRGGFKWTHTGGFRYYCHNGGCEFNDQPTGWEPGNGFGGRPRRLFELLGGNVRDIPLKELMRKQRFTYDEQGNIVGQEKDLEVSWKFSDQEMPKGSKLLVEAAQDDERAMAVAEYLLGRGEFYLDEYPFMWSSLHPQHLLIPYLHYQDQIVGYLGRNIVSTSADDRFIQRSPSDFMFNQYLISQISTPYLLVVESPMDAIALRCVATRGSHLTEKQVNLLTLSGKRPVLIPDRRKGEWEGYLEVAEEHGWHVSTPSWGSNIKDPGESVRRNGRLFTVQTLMDAMTTNYVQARIKLTTSGT